MKQLTHTTAGFDEYGKTTRRAAFLAEMEHALPWGELEALIEAVYPKAGYGCPPVGLERLLRVYLLQHWFNLQDLAVEEALYESASMRAFVGIDLARAPAPTETTIGKFRQLMKNHGLDRRLMEVVGRHLQSQGLRLSTGTIVDATVLRVPGWTRSQAGNSNPDSCPTSEMTISNITALGRMSDWKPR